MISLNVTLLVQMAIFLSFTIFIQFFLFRPMGRYFARRRETLEQLQSATAENEAALNRAQQEYSRKIALVRDEMLSLRTAARKEAMDIQKAMLDESKRLAHLEVAEAETELQKEIARARETLARESRSLAASIYQKILGRTCEA